MMLTSLRPFWLLGLAGAASALLGAPASVLETYNVVWDTPSANASESMPCGGGDVGLNVWVENGDLLVYLARSGAFDENNFFPKLGRVRVHLDSDALRAKPFRQELKLREGRVEIEAGAGPQHALVRVWVDVRRPVTHVVVDTATATSVAATYESWRLQDHTCADGPEAGAFVGGPVKAITRPDIVGFAGNTVTWHHRNRDETLFDLTVAQQGLGRVKGQMWNPLHGLTFGGTMYGPGLVTAGNSTGRYASTDYRGWRLASAQPGTHHEVSIALHVASTETADAWRTGLERIVQEATATAATAEAETQAWWAEFWKRSYVYIRAQRPDPQSREWQAGRNYQVFRYQLGCNARGEYPTKFNGGLFTFDPEYVDPKYPYSPDFRRWGGGTFTAQNQRLVYWPMLKNGDYDLMPAQLKFYLRARRNAELRSEVYWGVKGASFTEQIEQFGLPLAFEYGWKRPAEAPVGIEYNNWLEYLWDTSLEFCLMALDLQQHTGADITAEVALTQSCLSFFDEYYRQAAVQRGKQMFDGQGKLILYPGSATETYKMAYNATSTIAALRTVLTRLLELPEPYLTAAERARWKEMLQRLPALSFREMEGHRTIAPAQVWARINNQEIPQLYPVYPWGLYGVGKPDLQVAIDTWKYGIDAARQKNYISWHQDAIFCARLGLTDEAAEITLKKMSDSPRRFPTWWGPGHDWVPDHNWGGSGMIGIQEMLMQTDGRRIFLFPAWPKTWDVAFKLHAPFNTTVEAELKEGKIVTLRVSPESRRGDVQLLLP